MVGAVARRAMAVLPAIVAWQEPVERVEGILIGTGPELDDHKPGRRMRDEDVEQSVTLAVDEAGAGRGQVGETRLMAGAPSFGSAAAAGPAPRPQTSSPPPATAAPIR